MAFGRLERPRPSTPMSEINMTPLIDVMLVLLVIFIVSAPLLGSSLKLKLPQGTGATANVAKRALAITINAEGEVRIAGDAAPKDEWAARFAAAARQDAQTEVQLRADRTAPYGLVAEVIGEAHRAGLTRIGLVTEPAPRPATARPGS